MTSNVDKLTHLPARQSQRSVFKVLSLTKKGKSIILIEDHHKNKYFKNVKYTKNKEEETRRIGLFPCRACGWEWLYVTKYVCTANSQLTEET